MTEVLDGQTSLFDRDSWFGKMSPEHSAVTSTMTEVTSERSWKKLSAWQNQPLLFLDCRQSRSGQKQESLSEILGLSHGELTMLNIGESPNAAVESRLSQILEEDAPEKYSLSQTACQGILRRAEKRGKQLPEQLRKALETVANR